MLRSRQMCNLSEIVARPEDTPETLSEKARFATLLGTVQSLFTDFVYLNPEWKENCEEERLLGVSITGIMDNELLSGKKGQLELEEFLRSLRQEVVEENKRLAELLGINQSTACTAVKPSGTVSKLCDTASGIHPRYAKNYLQTIRLDNKDPVTRVLKEAGMPWEPCLNNPSDTSVFSFAIEGPEGCVTRDDVTALEQLELWKVYQLNWCEHKPSITVYVKEHEWLEVGAWVYKNMKILSGVSFLPFDNGSYQQAPWQVVTPEEFQALQENIESKDINWSLLTEYENDDRTEGSQELACTGGACEII